MSTLIFKQAATKALLGAVLWGGTTLVPPPAGAQAVAPRQLVLSPGAQQTLTNIMRNTTPYGRRLVWNALLKIGPERAEGQLAQLNRVSSYDLQVRAQIFGSILQALPAEYHQAFVNGLFQASPQEEQFASQVINGFAQAMNSPGTQGPSNGDFLDAQRMNRWYTLMQHLW